MPDVRDDLLRLYASQKVDEVTKDPEYQRLCERHKLEDQFNGERNLIERIKRRLENRLDGAADNSIQVRLALEEINKNRREAQLPLYRELIDRGYAPHWSPEQRRYFKKACIVILSKHDFFLSFTTRHSQAGEENPINTQHKHFIRSVIGKRSFDTADRSKKNLLAEALYQLLQQPPRHGFIFTQHENDNAIVQKKLKESCAGTFAFIQIIQNIMFQEPRQRPNYCFFEYKEAKAAIKEDNRLLFVVAEKQLIRDYDVPGTYEPWHQHITQKGAPYLDEIPVYSERQIQSLREKIFQALATRIDDERRAIFENVPI